MKNFLIKTSLFILLILSLFALMLSFANGYTDPFYVRFTTPQQENLILGTSRSAQGIQPQVFDSLLNRTFFNYSFTISHSPFGSVYLNSIKKKINPQTQNGIFILAVDPWSISNKGANPDDTTTFAENNLALSNVHYVNMNPNFEYLFKQFKGQYYKILTNSKSGMFLHNDGWLEITIAMDSTAVKKRLNEKILDYRQNNLPERKLSRVRLNYLLQTVSFLKQHGNVYLVRLPISPEMYALEQEFMPEFNEIIKPISLSADGYLDLTTDNYMCEFTDGNHLWKSSGKRVSIKIAEWIKTMGNYSNYRAISEEENHGIMVMGYR
jgi:hypothetical protein